MKTIEQVQAGLLEVAKAEMARTGEPMWMKSGKPGRWFDSPHWRCGNGHVTCWYVKSEQKGQDLCPACYEPVVLTFPEDVDDSKKMFTLDALERACRNIGYDLTCGACAELFFTGHASTSPHVVGCKTFGVDRKEPDGHDA